VNADRARHPCFDQNAAHRYARIHLPVAPNCNVQCNYCNRKNDCVNESRPGVTSVILSPGQAVAYLQKVMDTGTNVAVAGIAGPGDPFANAQETLETLRLVRRRFPELLLCVASNGLNVWPFADELARIGLSHATVTVNAVDAAIGAKIYAWVRQGRHLLRGREAAEAMLAAQRLTIRALIERHITVKVNTIIIPGINDAHVSDVAKEMAALGVAYMNALPVFPAPNTEFEHLVELAEATVTRIRREAEAHLPQMKHCMRCRADAAGLLGQSIVPECLSLLRECAALPLNPEQPRPFVAVASMEGALVNLHLGQASYFLIYRPANGGGTFVEARQAPSPGAGEKRWNELSSRLNDCKSILVTSAGAAPREVLQRHGIKVIETEGLIADALDLIANGRSPREPSGKLEGCGCSSGGCGTRGGCSGNGTGCD